MRIYLLLTLLIPFFACANTLSLKFLDEYIIPADLTIEGSKVGGLSSIEYIDGKYLLICDDQSDPRYYQAAIEITHNKIQQVNFEKPKALLNPQLKPFAKGTVDPEGLRVLSDSKYGSSIVWSSEGSIRHKRPPAIFMQSKKDVTSFSLPKMFDISENSGPYHNEVFEGLALAHSDKGVWVSMEGALKQDGELATVKHGSMLRISYFDFDSKALANQFAYFLEPIVNRKEAKASAKRNTGLVEILQIDPYRFLTMERSFTSGIANGGNDVRIFVADISKATDTSNFKSLKSNNYQPAKKTLVLDLADVKQQFASKRIDNLEGMTLGPKLANGNQSLLMISDNNFNAHGQQISQILLFELEINQHKS